MNCRIHSLQCGSALVFVVKNSGFDRAIIPYLNSLDIFTPRTDAKIECLTLSWLANLFGHQVHLTLIKQAYSHQPLKLQ